MKPSLSTRLGALSLQKRFNSLCRVPSPMASMCINNSVDSKKESSRTDML